MVRLLLHVLYVLLLIQISLVSAAPVQYYPSPTHHNRPTPHNPSPTPYPTTPAPTLQDGGYSCNWDKNTCHDNLCTLMGNDPVNVTSTSDMMQCQLLSGDTCVTGSCLGVIVVNGSVSNSTDSLANSCCISAPCAFPARDCNTTTFTACEGTTGCKNPKPVDVPVGFVIAILISSIISTCFCCVSIICLFCFNCFESCGHGYHQYATFNPMYNPNAYPPTIIVANTPYGYQQPGVYNPQQAPPLYGQAPPPYGQAQYYAPVPTQDPQKYS